ncbi:hypothetical protein ED28_00140 [[Pantoea] beijingensis]|uniref:Fimbrial-type adhesion domain-containing protein n=1 Tax=[Pantoea] beijingensis TaxID=1324864 RepID=A0A443IHF5_9GAMM|nr:MULTISPECIES: fimbrial protein [Erwiniaceae]RWR03431.1 hypothetical protein ED28_00140 [[Pantoea] beijingensis]
MLMTTTRKTTAVRHIAKSAVLTIALSALPLLAQADTSKARVTIKGTILANTCEIANGESIDLGAINQLQFRAALYKAKEQKVITLEKCGTEAKNVKVVVRNIGNNSANSSEAAVGVEVVLFNGNKELVMNQESDAITLKKEGKLNTIVLAPALRMDMNTFKSGRFESAIDLDITYP